MLILKFGVKIHKFKAKESKIKAIPLCLGRFSKDVSTYNMKKTGFYGYVYDFSVDYNAIAVGNILDIHAYVMKKNDIKCLDLLKKCLLQ